MNSMFACILWSNLLNSQDWVLYLVVYVVMNFISCSGRALSQDPGPVHLVVWGPEWDKVVHWFPRSGEAINFALKRGSHELFSLCKYHCKWGCWMNYTRSHVLWLDALVRQAGGCIQQWTGLSVHFPIPDIMGEVSLETVKLFVCLSNSSTPASQYPWPNRCIGFSL